MAAVLTQVQTKQIIINIHKRNNTKNTVQNNTKHSKYKYIYYQNNHAYTHTHTHLRGLTAASGVSNKPAFQRRTLVHDQVNNRRGSVFSRIIKQILFFKIHSGSRSQFNYSLTDNNTYSVRFLDQFFQTRSPPFTML